jgi:hypothetical protein
MTTRPSRLHVALAIVAAIGLSACGARPSHTVQKPAQSSAAFKAALRAALDGNMQQGAVLRRQPNWLAAAIRASLADPLSVELHGDPYLPLVSQLPRRLATPLVEEAIERYGIAPYSYQLPHAFLLREIRTGPPWAAAAALALAQQPIYVKGVGERDESTFLLRAYEAAPASIAASAPLGYAGPPGFLAKVLADARITPTIKTAILSLAYIGQGSMPVLERFVRSAPASPLKEQALLDLVLDGAPDSVQELAAFSDRHHDYPGIVWPATVMTAVQQADPRGYIARGMAAVSRLTGTAYVDTARCDPPAPYCAFWIEGPEQYDPNDLAAWQSLLARFDQHPGADDIAYTIGRIDEIDHRYGAAVLAFYRALSLPDGDMRYDAASRLLWVLDVEMSSGAISRLMPTAPGSLQPVLRYARAVHLLREGRYDRAIADLVRTTEHLPALYRSLSGRMSGMGYALPKSYLDSFIAWQLQAASKLRAAAHAAGTPQGAFVLAQYTFQNELLYYLGLWQGGRAGYIAFGSGNTIPSPAWLRYQDQFINYAVAARLYARAAGMSGNRALKAKDLFGEGESLVELMQYGAGADLYPPLELLGKAKALLRAAATADPHGSIGGSALMSLYYLTGAKPLLNRVIKDYAGTAAAYDAKLRLEPRHAYRPLAPPAGPNMDFQPLYTSNRLSVAERRALSRPNATGGIVLGSETILVLAPNLPHGTQPAIESVRETAPGHLLVQWGTYDPATVPGLQPVYFQDRAYARVFAVFHHIRFVRVNLPPVFGW